MSCDVGITITLNSLNQEANVNHVDENFMQTIKDKPNVRRKLVNIHFQIHPGGLRCKRIVSKNILNALMSMNGQNAIKKHSLSVDFTFKLLRMKIE